MIHPWPTPITAVITAWQHHHQTITDHLAQAWAAHHHLHQLLDQWTDHITAAWTLLQ